MQYKRLTQTQKYEKNIWQ